ncbi:MAG: right-handed parallel beta-helix repeat-containing protein [Chloroflexi bacterium]|nr:right-handed parallel beta-helix repeat-containing protein [Chloroflexota bacterium]OJV91092.1 MAG: hypothetical protein BGO39_26225 [Chloroflexi bacterium 54-19]
MMQLFISLGKQRYFLLGLTLTIIFSLLPLPSHNSVQAANPTYTVNSTGDQADDNPGDNVCHTSAGTCTLRAAITEANTAPNSVINFNIGASGSTQTIAPLTAFAVITQPVTIDGTSQPGYSDAPLIEIEGSNTGAGVNGLTLEGGSSTIKGLIINRFGGYGIELRNNGNNVIQGNYIGTDSTGQVALGNTNSGIWVNEVPNNTIGGTTTGTRNIISGNSTYGVQINGNGSTGNRVQGNYIGTDVSGLNSVGNSSGGVCICGGSTTTIGGTSAAARNIISGNTTYGIYIQYGGAVNNVVQGNYIGINADTNVLANSTGIYINGAGSNTIGGGVAGAGNYIAGNTNNGILVSGLEASGTSIQGNFIGLKPDLTALGNGSNGIMLDSSASNTTIGGSLAAQYNTIAYNNGAGIFINSGTGHRVQGNSIFSNQGLGIDIAPAGVNPNDTGDSDTGPNNLQNFPVLSSVSDSSGTTTIQGVLNSTPSTSFNLAFYSNASCDGSGNGEGQNYLTTQSVSTNGSGVGTFSVTTPTPDAQHRYITITATDTSGQNTSEFSTCNTLVAITDQPVDQYINPNNTATLTVTATGTPTISYQWYQGTSGDTTTPVGTNSASFTTPPLTTGTSYWVRVTNFAGSEDSQTATVNVSCLYVTQASDTGAGTCGTLSGAINEANTASTDVTISFITNTITINGPTPLNRLNNTNGKIITVDGGCTAQGNQPTPQVQLIAGTGGVSPDGLGLGSKVTVNGLKITGFTGYALDIQGDNNQVTCSWLGTADGTTASANGGGIRLGTVNGTAANNNSIGLSGQALSGNVIAGNIGTGLKMNKGSGNQLYYNLVGLNINGDVLSNTGGAISIQAGGNLKFGTGNRIHA